MSGPDPMSPETRQLFKALNAQLSTHMAIQRLQGTAYINAAIDAVGVLGELLVPIIAAIDDDQHREHILGLLIKHLPGGIAKCRAKIVQNDFSETVQ